MTCPPGWTRGRGARRRPRRRSADAPPPDPVARRARRRPRVGGPQDPARPADRPGPQPQGARPTSWPRKDVPDEIATRLLDRFEEVGLVDDEAFARAWVASRAARQGPGPPGAGPGAAPQGHRRRGRPRGARRDRPRRRGGRGPGAGPQEAAHRCSRVDDTTATRRLVGMLARKGYASGLAFAVVRDELAAAEREHRPTWTDAPHRRRSDPRLGLVVEAPGSRARRARPRARARRASCTTGESWAAAARRTARACTPNPCPSTSPARSSSSSSTTTGSWRPRDDPRRPRRRHPVAAERARAALVGRRRRADAGGRSRRKYGPRIDGLTPTRMWVVEVNGRSVGLRPGLPDRRLPRVRRCWPRTPRRSASTTRSAIRPWVGRGLGVRMLWAWMLRARHRFPDATTYFAAPDHRNAAVAADPRQGRLHRGAVVRRAAGRRHRRHGGRLHASTWRRVLG